MDSWDTPGVWINSLCINVWNVRQNDTTHFTGCSSTPSAALLSLKWSCSGLPWGLSGKESACQCKGHGVWSLIREDPACRGTTKPVRHNYWACALEPGSPNYWNPCASSLSSATREATAVRSPHTATREWPPLSATRESPRSSKDPAQSK